MEAHGEVLRDVEAMVARASKAFGALCRPVFQDNSLSLETKRIVYRAVVMGGVSYSLGWKLGRTREMPLGS